MLFFFFWGVVAFVFLRDFFFLLGALTMVCDALFNLLLLALVDAEVFVDEAFDCCLEVDGVGCCCCLFFTVFLLLLSSLKYLNCV